MNFDINSLQSSEYYQNNLSKLKLENKDIVNKLTEQYQLIIDTLPIESIPYRVELIEYDGGISGDWYLLITYYSKIRENKLNLKVFPHNNKLEILSDINTETSGKVQLDHLEQVISLLFKHKNIIFNNIAFFTDILNNLNEFQNKYLLSNENISNEEFHLFLANSKSSLIKIQQILKLTPIKNIKDLIKQQLKCIRALGQFRPNPYNSNIGHFNIEFINYNFRKDGCVFFCDSVTVLLENRETIGYLYDGKTISKKEALGILSQCFTFNGKHIFYEDDLKKIDGFQDVEDLLNTPWVVSYPELFRIFDKEMLKLDVNNF